MILVKQTSVLGQFLVAVPNIATPKDNESAYNRLANIVNINNRHTVMVTGSAKRINNKTVYDVMIWGSEAGTPIQLITQKTIETKTGYAELWETAKGIAVAYFDNNKFGDGAYTQYLDHITMKY